MSSDLHEIRQAVRAILRDKSTQEHVLAAEQSGWNAGLWTVLVDSGFAAIGVPEQAGGSGGTVAEACAVLHELGRYAASVPYAEHALIGGWLLAEAGRTLPDGAVTVALSDSAPGSIGRVPWASAVETLILVTRSGDGGTVHLLPTVDLNVTRGRNLADEARDTVTVDSASATASWDIDAAGLQQLRLRGALSRAALMGGALERVVELSVRYTNEREQFGRPVARFQAVQRHLVRTAEQAEQAMIAYRAAALNATDGLDFFDVAAAKIVAGECATAAAAASHQAHGAIGMTKEYELGQLTRRLWSWRDEYGAEAAWSRELGKQVVAAGADALWPRISLGVHAPG